MMKLKRRRVVEVPLRIKSFIENVITTPLENIEEALRSFLWDFEKGDFHHWIDLFNHFDVFFEKYIKPRKDLQLEVNDLEADPPFPREAVLQILRVIRIILENCTNKHFYSSYEHHISSLLACTDADIVEACLQTLTAFLKKTIGKYILRDASLNSKLFAFAQGWGGKEEGLGLAACAVQNVSDTAASELGSSLHFEFYSLNDNFNELRATDQHSHGLQIINLPDINVRQESDLVLLSKLVSEYKVPVSLRFSLFTRLRFARAFTSLASRLQYTCIRLYAFIVLVQACGDSDDMVSFFNNEPEFINELITLLSYENVVPEKIRVLSILSLAAVCQDRARQATVLTAVTSGGHRGILSSQMQKVIDSILNGSSKWSVAFAEALLSLVTVLVSSSSGCSAMREAGFIPTLLPLLKDMDPQHLHLVSMAVHVLEAFMDYSNPAATLFRDLGGLDDTILRLKLEVSHVENGFLLQSSSLELDISDSSGSQVVSNTSSELDNMQPLYSEALVAYHRRLLIKALLRAISLGTYAPGATARISGSEESLLPHCLCILFRRAKDFGGGVFSLAATVMSDLIHKDPTCFAALEAAGLPSTFIDAIMDGVLCSAEAIGCIPQCLDALCLNSNGLKAVKERNALMCFVKIFTSRTYTRALTADTLASLSSGLDELMRHASPLRVLGVDMLIEILNTLARLGSGTDSVSSSTDPHSVSVNVPMETDADDKCMDLVNEKVVSSEQPNEASFEASSVNTESFLPDCISNAAHLLEAILQNSDTCRIFVEKKGIEAVLNLFVLPSMPPSISVGQSISVAFKNFSQPHSALLARAVCSFLREHLTSTLELLICLGGAQLAQVEPAKRLKIARYLSNLDGILSLANSLLKVTTAVVSELGSADSEVFKDLGGVYREILWQLSLYCDSKVDGKQSVLVGSESPDVGVSNAFERRSDDDANAFPYRLPNPASVRSSTHSHWAVEREFLTVVRSTEGFNRRMRHGISRVRGGRSGRHLEALQNDSESMATISDNSSQDMKRKSLDDLVLETLSKVTLNIRTFFTSLVKGFTSPNRRRNENTGLTSASKCIGTALSKVFLEALIFSGYSSSSNLGVSLKCRYFGKVVDDIVPLIFDSRRSTCYTTMINYLYVHGTFKEILTTFEATSQLLWTLPLPFPSSESDNQKAADDSKLSQNLWLIETLQSYCRLLDHFVNSELVLSSTSASQSQLLVQPAAVGLSIGLFSVPKDPKVFIRMLQSQVMEVILPIWNHKSFASCSPGFITSVISLMTRVYCGVGDVKQSRSGFTGSLNQRLAAPPPDEGTIAAIVEMGFSRARAEEALRRAETNSVEMAMEWLFSHAEDPVQEEDELARALALSLGNSSESSKVDSSEKPLDVLVEEQEIKTPNVDDILAATLKLFHNSESVSFSLTDLLLTLCSRNKGEDRSLVISYLVQQLNMCPMDFLKDNSTLCMISHTLALLLSEDESAQDDAVRSGIVSVVMNILTIFMNTVVSGNEILIPKSLSSLLLIMYNLLQSKPKISGENVEQTVTGVLPVSSKETTSSPLSEAVPVKKSSPDFMDEESDPVFEKIFGKPRGFLTIDESRQLLSIACNLIKLHVPSMVMQAVLLLCSRLTKTHALAKLFIENGGLVAIFDIPRSCFFPGYDKVTSGIIRHLIEDPQTLQSAMESEIRQVLGGNRHASRVSVRAFLISTAPVICRDPGVFMKAAAAVCQLESSGSRTTVVLSKDRDKEKEKEKAKALVGESGLPSNEPVRIYENKALDGSVKCPKGHKKVPVNLTLVVDHLLEILLAFPPEEYISGCPSAMEVDTGAKNKGKSKIDEAWKVETDAASEKTGRLAKVSFILKLLTDIMLVYVHATGVILKRDLEMSQSPAYNQTNYSAQGGVVHHALHRLLPLAKDKCAGLDEWRDKLSEKASYFLVILSSRSSEGRRRVINELVKALSLFPNSESSSSQKTLFPSKEIFVLVDLVYAILSKNSSSGNLPGSGCSPDVAKSMIDGGMVQSLSNILQVIDLDHPDAPKIINIILKALESLTRAANSSELHAKFDSTSNKNSINVDGRLDGNLIAISDTRIAESNGGIRHSQGGVTGVSSSELAALESFQNGTDQHRTLAQPSEQEMSIEEENEDANQTLEQRMDYVREDMVEGSVMNDSGEQMGMVYRVENQVDDEMNDEDDEMGEEGEDEDDDDEEDDGFIVENDTAVLSLDDTDVEDHDDTGLGNEYNEDFLDEEDDDFHENRVIEVRWREALGLDRLQVHGQPGAAGGGLINVSAEPFEGVNVDDLFGMRRTFGFERRRQTSRTSFERPASIVTSLQHPLLQRPSQSGDVASSMLSGSRTSSHDIEAFSSRNFEASQLFTLDAPVLPYDNAISAPLGERGGGSAQPPLPDFSVGFESLRIPGRRGLGDDRWNYDDHPLSGGQVALIAQAIEEVFISRLSCSSDNRIARVSAENIALPESQQADAVLVADSQLPLDSDSGSHQNCVDGHEINNLIEGHSAQEEANNEGVVEHLGHGESTAHLISEATPDIEDDIEFGGENVNLNRQLNEVPSLLEPPSGFQADTVGAVSSEVTVNPHNLPFQVVGNGNQLVDESHFDNVSMSITAPEFHNVCSTDAGDNQVNGEPVSSPNTDAPQEASQASESHLDTDGANGNSIDPTFLEALPEDLRAEVLASQQAQHSDPPTSTPPTADDDIDPEFLAALPPDIQAEVLAQQRAQRIAHQAAGQPVEMDNASIIATFPTDLREEVLLTSSEAVLSALPSPLLAEAQMLRDRAMSHYQARSLFGVGQRLNNRRNNLGLDRQTVIDRGIGVANGLRVTSSATKAFKLQEVEGEQLLDTSSLKALIRLLRLAQPLGKGLLQRLLLNLCAHSSTRATLVRLLLDTINPQHKDPVGGLTLSNNSFRLYGCKSNVVYARSQIFDGLPPLVLQRILEILTYLANNHSTVASLLCFFDDTSATLSIKYDCTQKGNGKVKIMDREDQSNGMSCSIPLMLFLKLLNQPLFLRSIGHLEQVMGLVHVVVHTAASKWESQSHTEDRVAESLTSSGNGVPCNAENDASSLEVESSNKCVDNTTTSKPISSMSIYDIFMQLPQFDLRNLCSLLGHEGLSDKVYLLTGEVVKKLASVATPLSNCFILELSGLAQELSSSAVNELVTLRTTHMLGLSSSSMAGSAVLRVLQILSSFTSATIPSSNDTEELEEHVTMLKLNVALEPLWHELSECVSSMETELAQGPGDHHPQGSLASSSLPPGTHRLLPFIEALFVLCEKLQANNVFVIHDIANDASSSSSDLLLLSTQRRVDGTTKFTRFAEKHRRLLNAFVRQNHGLLEKSLSMLLKAPRLIDFDNKKAYFRSRIRQQHEQHLSGSLRISIRRAYVLEDSYNQLRMRPTQDLKGRLNVHFQGEEGIDAGGLTREWYQLLSRVIFDKGALLFTTVGNNTTFQPNPNSVYQTEHLSYFRFVGRVVAKAVFDGQLLDVYFTRSFYKHILGVKVTYHDIEAVDPDYYKNLKWMLENDVSDIPDLTFSMDADEEKHILYEKAEVTDYELKPGGRNIRVTEETKQEYVDLVADHILTNAIRPQINSFLEGFNELVPKDIISIFNDKELELLISGLPEIDLDDMKANTEYTGYTAASAVAQWFWEVVFGFNKEDRARLLQFVTGTSKVPLEGFKALQGISGGQIFQIHKAYGTPERLPSAHTCFNQLDLPEYASKEQLQERLLLAIHEANEGFGFG